MYHLLIVEDQTIVLDGLSRALDGQDDFMISGKLKDANDILPTLRKGPIDLLLADIMTANQHNTLDFLPAIKAAFPSLKIVLMTGLPEVSFFERAKKAGVDSFVYKNISIDELLGVLSNTMKGYEIYPKASRDNEWLQELTEVEMQIVRLACHGYTRKEISESLSMSDGYTKNHISDILLKSGFESLSKLAIYCVSNHLIVPENDQP
jgi:two-component system vancomycin resistance associated response regulator VraR